MVTGCWHVPSLDPGLWGDSRMAAGNQGYGQQPVYGQQASYGQQTGDSQQPEFAWIPEWKGPAKLFIGEQKRQDIARDRSLRILVFPWGFTWINGDDELTARWGEVSDVVRNVTRHTHQGLVTSPDYTEYHYTVRLADGRCRGFKGRLVARQARTSQATRLSPVPDVTTPVTIEQVGRLLEQRVTQDQLPKAIARFNAGEAVVFGPLTVSRAGITAGAKALSWNEVKKVTTTSGTVALWKTGKWMAWKTVSVGQIPNYFVFNALVQSILEQRRPG